MKWQKDRDVTLDNFLVDKEGVFYMLAKLTETKKQMKEKGKEKGVKPRITTMKFSPICRQRTK